MYPQGYMYPRLGTSVLSKSILFHTLHVNPKIFIDEQWASIKRHMVHIIMEMVSNRSFTLTTGNGQRNRLRHLKNGIPQGSVLAPLLFNIYTSDLPATTSRKYAYADDLAIMHADGDWLAVEGALSKDMATLGEYLQTWKLKLSTMKMVSAVFHLSNKEAKCELKINLNN